MSSAMSLMEEAKQILEEMEKHVDLLKSRYAVGSSEWQLCETIGDNITVAINKIG